MATPLQVDPVDPPDLTNTLKQGSKRLAGGGSFGTVYRCLCALNGEVSMFALTLEVKVSPFSLPLGCGQGHFLPSLH